MKDNQAHSYFSTSKKKEVDSKAEKKKKNIKSVERSV